MTRDRHLILVKHAMPQVDVETPVHLWRLRPEGVAAAATLALRLLNAGYIPSKVVASLERKATLTGSISSRIQTRPDSLELMLDTELTRYSM